VAKGIFRLPEEFLLKISRLAEKTDVIVPKVLKTGAKVVEKKLKSNLVSAVGKNTKQKSESTGQLADALGISPAMQDKNGNYNIKVGFSENRSDGKSNAMLANVLEYGKSGQPPRPFLKPAKSASRNDCIEAMKASLDKEFEEV